MCGADVAPDGHDAQIRKIGEQPAAHPPPAVQEQIEKATVACIETTGAT